MNTATEDIKARLNIVELVGQYVKLQRSGTHWKANCPFHQEKTPSFMVNEERQMWHCFGCGKGGDAFAFVMEIEGIDFREALKLLAERAGVELPQYSKSNQPLVESKDRSIELLELSTKFYEQQLWESDRGKPMLTYLRERGLIDESMQTFRLGYAPHGWRHLLEFLLKRGYALEEIERAGLVIKKSQESGVRNQELSRSPNLNHPSSKYYDRFRDRIMFPIADVLGRVIGYSARVAPGGDESQAKYVNTPETALYHKSRALYGLHLAKQAIKAADTTVLVEGNMDVIALHQAGVKNAVAVSGTALTVEQLKMLKRYGKRLRLFFDMDAAGQAAAWKSAGLAFENELAVEMVALPHGKDAADMNRENPELLRSVVERAEPAMDYFLRSLQEKGDVATPAGKRFVAERAVELLSLMRNPIERDHWIKRLARIVDSEERAIRDLVVSAMSAKRYGVATSKRGDMSQKNPKTFSRRSETLRESIIGLLLADTPTRESLLASLDADTRAFLAAHPLFFFIQNATDDPIAVIEDVAPKQEASRLLFQALALPVIAEAEPGEQALRIRETAEHYLLDLKRELAGKDKLHALGAAIDEARARGDKAREQSLLADFATLSQKTHSILSSEE